MGALFLPLTPWLSCQWVQGLRQDKPLGGPGGLAVILGSLVSLAAAVALFLFYRLQPKNQPDMDSDLSDPPTSHKASPLSNRNEETKNHVSTKDIQLSDLEETDLHYAELDTIVLESSPGTRTPGELVEYAIIQSHSG